MTDPNESPMPSPRKVIKILLIAFAVPVVLIVMIASYFGNLTEKGAGGNSMSPEAVAERLQPIGVVVVEQAAASTASAPVLKSGIEVYKTTCGACHGEGIAGAPKAGDKAAWGPRIAQGFNTLVKHAVDGFQGKAGVMPPKGGGTYDPIEVARAVAWMADQAGANFKEPDAPAAKGAAPAAAPAAQAAAGGPALKSGEAVYKTTCVACHGAGVAGAPKVGDQTAWGPRIAQGFDTLVKHAVDGFQGKAGVMPPKGGGTYDPIEVARAVAWMADQAGAAFKEPEAAKR
jgi:cytochrome c5